MESFDSAFSTSLKMAGLEEDDIGDLRQLAFLERRKTVQKNPYLVSRALASLVGSMQLNMPNNKTGDKFADAESAKAYESQKQVFMSAAVKVFPDVKAPTIHLTDQRVRGIAESFASLDNTHLQLLKDYIDPIKSASSLRQGNPKELVDRLDKAIDAISRGVGSIVIAGGLSEAVEKELAVTLKSMYELQLLRDDLQKGLYGRSDITSADAEEVDDLRDKIMGKVESKKTMSFAEIKNACSGDDISTIEDVRRVVTPEIKSSLLAHMLEGIDARIGQGKELAAKNSEKTVIEAKGLSAVLGRETMGRVYQFVASAKEGRIFDAKDVAKMSIYEFLKEYLGYDLRTADPTRKSELDKYTNMLW